MTTRYQKSQIEDVATILRNAMLETIDGGKMASRYMDDTTVENLANDFDDLFAADNPPLCTLCYRPESTGRACSTASQRLHNFSGGFDRKQFLAACGLESES